MKKIKLFGERNTGTNYLVKLISLNSNSVEWMRFGAPKLKFFRFAEFNRSAFFFFTAKYNLGWKHAEANLDLILKHKDLTNIHFLTISKNPYSFLLSLYKRPYHYKYKKQKPATFMDFLQTPWEAVPRDMSATAFYKNPIHLWNEKNRSYLNLKKTLPNQTLLLNYESLLEDYEHELEKIFNFLKIDKDSPFENVIESTKKEDKSNSYYKDYYLNETWKDRLSEDEIAYINQHLDKDILKAFNYNLL